MKKIYLLVIALCFVGRLFSQCATAPTISSFSPQSGPAGTVVTITGTNFDPVAANNRVFFGNVKAVASSATATSLQVTVPAGATAQFLSVNKSCGNTAMLQYGFRVISPCVGPITSGAFSSVTSFPSRNRGYSAALGDLDGDGKPDMVVADYINETSPFSPTSFCVYRNLSTPGTVSFSDSVRYLVGSTQLYGIFIFDIDMDGKPDVLAHSGGVYTYVFRNLSTTPGTIVLGSRQDIFSTNGSWALTIGDMDGDGKPDIVYGGNSKAWIVRNISTPGVINFDGNNAFGVQMNDPAEFCNTTDVKVADLDADGKNDIVTANYNCSKVGVCRNLSSPGSFSFGSYFTYSSAGQTYGVAIGDLNNDGKPEVVAVNRNVGTSHIFQNQNTGTLSSSSFMSPVNISAAASTVLLQDVNGDGKPDILCSNGGAVSIFSNSNATAATITAASFGTASGAILSCGGTARMFDIGDVDGDGNLDMVSARDANYPNAKAEVIRRIPSPAFTGVVTATTLNVTTNCNDNTWKYAYDPANTDKVLVAVKDNNYNLGTITASVYADANYGTVNGQAYMRRHYVIKTTSNPVGVKRVRLYYTAADFTNLQSGTVGLNTASQLAVTKYSGPGEDGVYDPQVGGVLTFIPKASVTTGTAYGQNFLEFDVSDFSEFWIHTGLFVLPLRLLNFNANKCGNQVCLLWNTENEQQVSRFEIERSYNGQQFEYAGRVAAKNQLQNHYTTTDNISNQLYVYYRLKMVNVDGEFKYSDIIRIRLDKPATVTLSPNPVANEMKVTCVAKVQSIQLLNSVGQIVNTWKRTSNDQYNVSSVANGIYTLRVITDAGEEMIRLVINH